MAGSNGSIVQKTEKELPTGITPQPKNTTRGLQHKLPREMHTVDGLSREGRTCRRDQPGSVEGLTEEPGLQPGKAEAGSIQRHGPRRKQRAGFQQPWKFQPSKHVSGGGSGGSRGSGGFGGGSRGGGGGGVPVAVAAVDAAAVAAEGDNHVNSDSNHNETVEGGRNETSGNTG